jgi:thioredoxin reductase (NADPH)
VRAEVIIVGAGLAGLSAAIYLGRGRIDALVIHGGKSMARWEPDVENYLGFPKGIAGEELLRRGRRQAEKYGARFIRDEVSSATRRRGQFRLRGKHTYHCRRLLLATGAFHVPPDIPGVKPCLGHSMFFCKDCDGFRVRNQRIAIYGWTNEAVEYGLAMLAFSPRVMIVTDGRAPRWDRTHARWLKLYQVPSYTASITRVRRRGSQILALVLEDRETLPVDGLFTTRGDRFINKLARDLGARVDSQGQVLVNSDMRTSVPGLFAAGCLTGANCQMVIAAGQGAIAAQAINRELFEARLAQNGLRRAALAEPLEAQTSAP